MKILHFSKYYPPYYGGIETVAYDIVDGLNNNNIKCDVICFNDKNETVNDKVDNHNVFRASVFKEMFSTPLSLSIFNKFIKIVGNYNIIHIHHPNPIATLCCFLMSFFIKDKKIIVHWHSDIIKQKKVKKIFLPIQNWMLNKASLIIVTSSVYGDNSRDLVSFSNKIKTIPIGIEDLSDNVNYLMLKSLKNKYEDKFVVFTLGRHIYYKGFEYLIRSANHLPDNVIILIGGAGELTDEYNEIILNNNLEDKVEIIGRIPSSDLSAYFSLCDIFCLPSIEKSEAFGVVQLEAMSFGKPLISTNIEGSGVSWVNKHMESGLVVENKSSKSLAKAILTIKDNEKLRMKLAFGSKQRFRNYFTKEIMVKSFIDTYKNLL